jgi:hypothetical protein
VNHDKNDEIAQDHQGVADAIMSCYRQRKIGTHRYRKLLNVLEVNPDENQIKAVEGGFTGNG